MRYSAPVLGLTLAGMLLGATPTFSAQLPQQPQVFLDTTYVAPTGRQTSVPAGGDLQGALNAAQPGDVLILQSGATYTGNFTLPAKSGTGWIHIQGTALSSLPAPGVRVGPTQANLMPKIVSPNTMAALTTAAGAHHYRFVGIEITTTWASTSATNFGLVALEAPGGNTTLAQVPTDLVFDRCYIHGTPTGNVRRGVLMNSARTAVVDSHLSDLHEVGADSQAIGGWNGPGPFKIVNNYLAGAGENIMFGGADPRINNLVPSDIEIRKNHIAKPLTWRAGHPSYAGIPWSVKNLFELKNAQRVLIDGNLLENNWADAQNGYGILFTVRNQQGTAPWSVVRDVTFTNNIVRHSGAGLSILGRDYNHPSQQTQRILIQNNLVEDVGARLGRQRDLRADHGRGDRHRDRPQHRAAGRKNHHRDVLDEPESDHELRLHEQHHASQRIRDLRRLRRRHRHAGDRRLLPGKRVRAQRGRGRERVESPARQLLSLVTRRGRLRRSRRPQLCARRGHAVRPRRDRRQGHRRRFQRDGRGHERGPGAHPAALSPSRVRIPARSRSVSTLAFAVAIASLDGSLSIAAARVSGQQQRGARRVVSLSARPRRSIASHLRHARVIAAERSVVPN